MDSLERLWLPVSPHSMKDRRPSQRRCVAASEVFGRLCSARMEGTLAIGARIILVAMLTSWGCAALAAPPEKEAQSKVQAAAAQPAKPGNAKLFVLDKLIPKRAVLTVPVGRSADFGDFRVGVKSCSGQGTASAVYIEAEEMRAGKPAMVYRGWLLGTTPGGSTLGHPRWEVFLDECESPTATASRSGSAPERPRHRRRKKEGE